MSAVGKRRPPSEWKDSDRVRRALYDTVDALRQLNAVVALREPDDAALEINAALLDDARAQMAALGGALGTTFAPATLPALPADCWRIVMEFALERRTMATFGAGGVVNEPWMWRPIQNNKRTKMLRSMRLVSRSWNRVASDLVLWVGHCYREQRHWVLLNVFRNVRSINGTISERNKRCDADCFCSACEIRRADDRLTLIAGSPHPSGYSRVYDGLSCRIDQQDRVCKSVLSQDGFIDALKTADIVYYAIPRDVVKVEPFVPRARIVYVSPSIVSGVCAATARMLEVLSVFEPIARQHMHISIPTQKYKTLAAIVQQLTPATIYMPISTGSATRERLLREFSNVQFVPKPAFDFTVCVAGPP